MGTRNVLLIGGANHDFEEMSSLLVALLNETDVESVVTSDVDEAVEELATADMFTIFACRWRMLNETPDAWVYELPEQSAQTITSFVENGGCLLGLHTASICFDTWYEYKRLLGGVWRMDQSFHSARGEVEVRVTHEGNSLFGGMSGFTLNDEIYHQLDVAPGTVVVAEGRTPVGAWQPVVWTREVGEGRVFYDALGHDGGSLQQLDHRSLLRHGVRWLLREED